MSEMEKQDLPQIYTPTPKEAVLPRLHPTGEIDKAIRAGDLRADALLQSFAYFAVEGRWLSVWNLADSLKREVSILFDAQGWVWVDIGTIGMVRLSPPIGSQIPLRLWVHTHPWNAYWSETDRRTLASVSGVLDEALVLGHDHIVRAVHIEQTPFVDKDLRLATVGPLMNWTAEAALSYSAMREDQGVVLW
jgi:hypothetical protein